MSSRLSSTFSTVDDLSELRRILELPDSVGFLSEGALPLRVPRHFVDLMERGNPNDPLLLQILPHHEEMESVEGFSEDPLEEQTGNIESPLLQKYPGRALLLTTAQCGIHCRFCFRRYYPKRCPVQPETALEPIRNDATVEEIILSGGDPLTLAEDALQRLTHYIANMPHVRRIRVHSRLPIVHPDRITPEILRALSLPKPVYLVVHVNHPNELAEKTMEKLQECLQNGMVVLAQTVLLKGINDDPDTLFRLCCRLIDHRVIPYYLHQLDKVRGAAHFEVESARGYRLIAELRDRLPGYAVPEYVRETIGANCKERIGVTVHGVLSSFL